MLNKVINVPLMLNPVNWGLVWSILLLMGVGFTAIVENARANCDCNS